MKKVAISTVIRNSSCFQSVVLTQLYPGGTLKGTNHHILAKVLYLSFDLLGNVHNSY